MRDFFKFVPVALWHVPRILYIPARRSNIYTYGTPE